MVAEEDSNLNNSSCSSSSFSTLKYSDQDLLINLSICSDERKLIGFKSKLLNQWEIAAKKGTLNYQIGDCKLRKLEGQYNICLQLNEDRCRKRRKPMEFESVCQPFDEKLWNFTKLKQEECLFHMHKITKENSISNQNSSQSLIAINASPLSIGHSLLIPSPKNCLPQILNFEAIKMSIELMLLIEDNNFLIIFNGLLAHASVNHLHLQTLFWSCKGGIMEKTLKVIPTKYNWLYLLQRPNWYLPAYVFQINNKNCIELISRSVEKIIKFLIQKGIAHNLFVCRSKEFNKSEVNDNEQINYLNEFVTLFLFPRKASKEGLYIGGTLTSTFVPAALEVAGLLPVYDSDFFNSTTESEIIKIFNERDLMSDENFELLTSELFDINFD